MSAESPGLVMGIAQLWQTGDWDATIASPRKISGTGGCYGRPLSYTVHQLSRGTHVLLNVQFDLFSRTLQREIILVAALSDLR